MTNRTLIDIELARIYFDILVTLAKDNKEQTINYGKLADLAKAQYPDSPHIQAAIATNMGRRLDALREFTSSNQMPDLSSLVVNKATGDNGEGFSRSFDGDAVRKQVADFNWNDVKVDFEKFLVAEIKALEKRKEQAKKPKKLTEDEARQLWWSFSKENKDKVSKVTLKQKEQIIKLLILLVAPEDALAQICMTSS